MTLRVLKVLSYCNPQRSRSSLYIPWSDRPGYHWPFQCLMTSKRSCKGWRTMTSNNPSFPGRFSQWCDDVALLSKFGQNSGTFVRGCLHCSDYQNLDIRKLTQAPDSLSMHQLLKFLGPASISKQSSGFQSCSFWHSLQIDVTRTLWCSGGSFLCLYLQMKPTMTEQIP